MTEFLHGCSALIFVVDVIFLLSAYVRHGEKKDNITSSFQVKQSSMTHKDSLNYTSGLESNSIGNESI